LTKNIIIAGPNGAGKTTFARSYLPQKARCPRFINADLIAAGLSPFAPESAAIESAVDTWAEFDKVGEKPTLLRWAENR
jgi:predicted ABC-type ATPase